MKDKEKTLATELALFFSLLKEGIFTSYIGELRGFGYQIKISVRRITDATIPYNILDIKAWQASTPIMMGTYSIPVINHRSLTSEFLTILIAATAIARNEREGYAFLDQAFNEGDGVYRP